MTVHCTNTHCDHETQCMKNDEPCAWCNAPMKAIGDCWMSDSDGSLSTEEIQDGQQAG
jgi:hypothetical protein